MSENAKNILARARLALRAERAFGLSALPVRIEFQSDAPAEVTADVATTGAATIAALKTGAKATNVAPPSVSPPPVSPAVDLFGRPAPMPLSSPKASQPMQLPVVSREPFTSPVLSRDEKVGALAELDEKQVKVCERCRLHETRKNTVFGEGDPDAKIMFIGEGPGENEDIQGRPFVGRAGDLLNNMIVGMGLKREQVFIVNIVKCRPPGNREPAPDEVASCTPFLEKQIEIIRPRVIVTLGRPALQHMLQQKISISRMRGQWQSWRGIRLMPTFHPAYLLRNYTQETRAAVWSDLQQVMQELGMPIPAKKSSS